MTENRNGHVLWITGLSGAGKTTVSIGVAEALRKMNIPCVLLDGDDMRSILASKWGYSDDERAELAFVYSRLCRHLSCSGINVIIATVAMFEKVREWNRDNIENYLEVFLRVPVDELINRDPKGLYKRFADDTTSESVLSDAFELPKSPDLVIDNYDQCSVKDAEQKVLRAFVQSLVYGSPALETQRKREKFKKGIVDYWNNAYQTKKTPNEPTSFAAFCSEKYVSKGDVILEFGCGNGRDTFFFARSNSVIAIDPSSVAIEKNRQKAREYSFDNTIDFKEGMFGEVSIPQGERPDIVYSRFVMHAMNEESENMALQEAAVLLKQGGLFLSEFRTVNDELSSEGFTVGNNEMITDHYRRFIDSSVFQQKLKAHGFEIIEFVESSGLAKLGDDDPVVARIVARKK